jgi:hypothetical protein
VQQYVQQVQGCFSSASSSSSFSDNRELLYFDRWFGHRSCCTDPSYSGGCEDVALQTPQTRHQHRCCTARWRWGEERSCGQQVYQNLLKKGKRTASLTDIVLQDMCSSPGIIIASVMVAAPVQDLPHTRLAEDRSFRASNLFPWAIMTGNCLFWVVAVRVLYHRHVFCGCCQLARTRPLHSLVNVGSGQAAVKL